MIKYHPGYYMITIGTVLEYACDGEHFLATDIDLLVMLIKFWENQIEQIIIKMEAIQ